MPRYTAVVPTFNPIDYQTRIRPLEQYKEEYDKRMDALDEQGVLADAIGGLIDPNDNRDKALLDSYNEFNTKMTDTARNLLQSGDLGSSRRALGELRRDYANKLLPIQQAFNSRAEAGKAFNEMKMKDPSYKGNNPLDNSISDYMHGNRPEVFGVSGDAVYNQGLNSGKAQTTRVRNILQDWRLDPKLGGEWFTRRIAEGYNASEVAAALAEQAGLDPNDENVQEKIGQLSEAGKYIYDATNRIFNSNGVGNLNSESDRNQIRQRIVNGIVDGLTYKESDEEKQHDPLLGLKAAKLRRESNPTDGQDPRNTSPRVLVGKHGEEGKIIDRATQNFKNPIVDQKTGNIIRNGFEAYIAIKRAEDRLLDISRNKPKGHIGDVENTPEYQEAAREYNRISNLYKDVAISKKEYNKIKKSIGFSDDRDMTIEDIIDASKNNFDFSSAINYNDHHIASKGYEDNLRKNILSKMRSNTSSRTKEIFKTKDGVNPDGKAIRYNDDILDNDKVESIDINPFTVARGFVIVNHGKGEKYLVPIEYMGNEAGLSVFANLSKGFSSYLSGAHSNNPEDILGSLDSTLHDAVITVQKNNGRNFYQSQPSTSK